jgi:urease accessory protein
MTLLQPSLATHNTAELQVTCRTVDGVTQIVEKYYKAPLKISKAFREDDSDRLCLYMVDVSPGMLDGDRYHLDFDLKENCHLVLTNQSFTKVHPCPRDEAQLHAKFRVGEGAVLEYFPEPTIPYADSVLKAVQRFDLASDATLLFAEVNTPGRTHRDEQYQFRRLDNQVEVYRAGKLVVWDHFLAEPLQSQIHATGAMESYTHNSTFWILTPRPSQTLLERIRGILSQLDEANMLAAASLTADKGICVRMLGHNVWQLQQLIQTIWNACREELLQLPACYFRK